MPRLQNTRRDHSQVVQAIDENSEFNLEYWHSIDTVVIVCKIRQELALHQGDTVIGRGFGVHNNKWGRRIARRK